jgi:hypothetical protein
MVGKHLEVGEERPLERQARRARRAAMDALAAIDLVPTARLELAQLSPLPPQDSVSTSFTTSAVLSRCIGSHEDGSPNSRQF